jgi:hypothetical protein
MMVIFVPVGVLGQKLSYSLVGGFTDRVMVGKASPNQGIKLSLRNFLFVFLISSLTVGLILVVFVVTLSIFGRKSGSLVGFLPLALLLGLSSG